MSTSIDGQINALCERRDILRAQLERSLSAASRAGREKLAAGEKQELTNLRALEARIGERESERDRAGDVAISALSSRVNARSATGSNMETRTVNDAHLTYRKNAGPGGPSYLRDLVRFHAGTDDTGESRQRLFRHADEVKNDPAFTEYRDLSRVDGQGGYAVAPIWLLEQYIPLARPGRVFANLCQRQPLPQGDSINVPKVLTGTSVAIQTADNQAIADVDMTDTFVNAPVRTIAGQQGISVQLVEQSQIDFTEVIYADLIAAHAAALDNQVLSGTGSNGQVLGVNYTPGIQTIAVGSVTIQGIYSAIANAVQLVHSTRFLPPTHIVMSPRRWAWLLSLLDTTDRPLFVPTANGPWNAGGVNTDVESQGVVGTTHGLPVVVDPNIGTNSGTEYGSYSGDEDVIYVVRASDLVLYESSPRTRILMETKASTLTVLCQLYSFLAFSAGRFPQSVVAISGLTPPAF